jgi:hypothetical protein
MSVGGLGALILPGITPSNPTGAGSAMLPGTVTNLVPLQVVVDGATSPVSAVSGVGTNNMLQAGTRVIGIRVGSQFYIMEATGNTVAAVGQNLTLVAGVTGSVYMETTPLPTGVLVRLRVEVSFASTSSLTTIVAAGGIPSAYCPPHTERGIFTAGTTIGRIDVLATGLIQVQGLTAAATGAAGFAIYTAGL